MVMVVVGGVGRGVLLAVRFVWKPLEAQERPGSRPVARLHQALRPLIPFGGLLETLFDAAGRFARLSLRGSCGWAWALGLQLGHGMG